MKIAIVGTGYVGLITGVSLAALGHKVVCIETDAEKVSLINSGKAPFFESGVNEALSEAIEKGLLRATGNLEQGVLASDITVIAVGTPTVNNKIDLTAIKKAAEQIGKALGKSKKYHIVVVKSTVVPGVTEDVVGPLLEKFSHKKLGQFGLCMNPEFLREGNALEDSLKPDRIVIGQYDSKSGKQFAKIYAKVSCPIVFTNLSTAEMIKYAANALFATLISYANEIATISENIGKVDVVDVWKGVHLDRRLSPHSNGVRVRPGVLDYIFSGCGYGGSCFPKDTKALANFAADLGMETPLIKSVIAINHTQPYRMVWHLKKALGKNLKNKKIAVLGIAFKPDTDDTRESAAFPIIEKLLAEQAQVIAHDPEAYKKNISPELKNSTVVLAQSIEEALKNADAVIVVTAWKHYKGLTPAFFKKHMKRPVVVDGRRIYDKAVFERAGVRYKGIGL